MRLCVSCNYTLDVPPDGDDHIILSAFPHNLGACFVHIAFGSGKIPCPECGGINDLSLPTCVLEPGVGALIFHLRPVSPALIAKVEAAVGEAPLDFSHDERLFKRSFLQLFVVRHATLLNNFIACEDEWQWIEENHERLDRSFFAALWLMASGAFVASGRPLESGLRDPFVPHEDLTPEERHLSRQREAEASVNENGGRLLAALVWFWVKRCSRQESLTGVEEAFHALFPKEVLAGEMGKIAAARLSPVIDEVPEDQNEVIWRYLPETVFALAFHAHGLPNPRADRWSGALLHYEMWRRINGSEGLFPIEPDSAREMIDATAFWGAFDQLATSIGPVRDETVELHRILAETIGTFFPAEAQSLMEPTLVLKAAAEDIDVSELVDFSFNVPGFDVEKILVTLESLLRGMVQRQPELIAATAKTALRRARDAGATKAQLIEFARATIEYLNRAARFHETPLFARWGEYLLRGAADMDAKLAAHFSNEVANCHRYAGRFQQALKCYYRATEVLGGELRDRNVRVGLRNIAIVMRDTYRYEDAIEILERIRPFAQSFELIATLGTEALCWNRLGEPERARCLVAEGMRLIESHSANNAEVRMLVGLHLQQLRSDGRDLEAADVARRLVEMAEAAGDTLILMEARLSLLPSTPPVEREQLTRAALEDAETLVSNLLHTAGLAHVLTAAIERLYKILKSLGETERTEWVLRNLLPPMVGEPSSWVLWTYAFETARDVDSGWEAESLVFALAILQDGLSAAAGAGDPAKFLDPNSDRLALLVEAVLEPLLDGDLEVDDFASMAADVGCAPISTARLRHAEGLGSPMRDSDAEEARREAILSPNVTAVQIVPMRDGVGMLFSSSNDRGGIRRSMRFLAIDPQDILKIEERLLFKIGHASLNRPLPVGNYPAWEELRRRIETIFVEAPAGDQLIISTGGFSPAIFSLALPERDLCFAPSLGAMSALRERRDRIARAREEMPRAMFDFSVWRRGDKAEVVAAFMNGIEEGRALSDRLGLRYDASIGPEADKAALLGGLRDADIVRIACHGRLIRDAEQADLIVANDGRLPPSSTAALLSKSGTDHILGWRTLQQAQTRASLVISSACHAGASIHHSGGENLGIGRSLLDAGAVAYVAPLWPVPSAAAQQFSTELLKTWLESPGSSLAQALTLTRRRALVQGVSELAVWAFAILGDGL